METMKQGDIYLVSFGPGKGHEYEKVRPAIIIMSDATLKKANLAACIPMTSNTDNCINDDVIIGKDATNRLFQNSVAKIHHITACDESRLIKKVGNLSASDLKEVKKSLVKVLGLE